ncbi:dnaJ homolog subfamily C member 3-like [Artemia franciscana]|uniref:J domain-containing protein n=1 Tax=Artemia franciscana TaxID=6661 RepID=A0AA88KVT8_ARTSF|nr:hypothetical protein QYM36_017565 [Artemia franciscana]
MKITYNSYCVLLLFLTISITIRSVDCSEVNAHLESSKQLMAEGRFKDALEHLHKAEQIESNNYLVLYNRAVLYLALKKVKSALGDLNAALQFKPNFMLARFQKVKILIKSGKLDEAKTELEKVIDTDTGNEEATKTLSLLKSLQAQYEQALIHHRDKRWRATSNILTRIIKHCPWDSKLLEIRSDCYLAIDDVQNAILDLRALTQLVPDNVEAFFKLSNLYYAEGVADGSLREVRKCLKLDPEHKLCFQHFKKVKNVAKTISDLNSATENSRSRDCIAHAKKLLELEPANKNFKFEAEEKLCQCSLAVGDSKGAIDSCTKAIEIERWPKLFCNRAEAYIAENLLEKAANDYSVALEINENLECANYGIKKVKRLQKQAKKRDYYKILGVSRDATKQDINKAYRKEAQKWHPDNFQANEDERKKAEMKFIDIANAKEVLTDPKKRKMFDLGEDPLDPDSTKIPEFYFRTFEF